MQQCNINQACLNRTKFDKFFDPHAKTGNYEVPAHDDVELAMHLQRFSLFSSHKEVIVQY